MYRVEGLYVFLHRPPQPHTTHSEVQHIGIRREFGIGVEVRGCYRGDVGLGP